jgi:UDP-N-acetylglucosamine transferase subunit ALG13
MISYQDMLKKLEEARIVITHGGPGTIMLARQFGKKPIVVPRRVEFNEHVDNHQVTFTEFLELEGKILAIYDIGKLKTVLIECDAVIKGVSDGVEVVEDVNKKVGKFCRGIEDLCVQMIREK